MPHGPEAVSWELASPHPKAAEGSPELPPPRKVVKGRFMNPPRPALLVPWPEPHSASFPIPERQSISGGPARLPSPHSKPRIGPASWVADSRAQGRGKIKEARASLQRPQVTS